MSRILGIIPARAGSKRIPGKNLKNLAGKPLIQYSIEAALESKLLTDIVITSDSLEILNGAYFNGQPIYTILRPSEMAEDTSLAIEYVLHSLDFMTEHYDKQYEYVVIIQPSSPFTKGFDIDQTIDLLLNSHAECAASVKEIEHDLHPSKFKLIQGNRLVSLFEKEDGKMAAHQLEKVFVRNGSVYISNVAIVRQGTLLTEDCVPYIMPASRSLDINTETDFLFAEFLIQQLKR
ncbi:MAG: acylneuraminate cytidylyltransferase family protein [Saprospiraceae bacterium]|nr:acylneuraminate cytidylyltransferase family protein [Saprospiraceae bacterium]MBK9727255.1 acylneuraminate cytidylyltransferase family protein [Saprospiraceae bacterium]